MKPLKVFVIQPYSKDHSVDFYNLINKVCEDSKGEFKAFRADTEPANVGYRLQDRIDSYIKKADICFADLTIEDPEKDSRNENVLLEVGAAYTLNIPVILVSNKKLPTDIEGNLYISLYPNKIKEEIVRHEFLEKARQRLWEAHRLRSTDNYRNNQFVVYGYSNRREVDFYTYIQRSSERICILTTNLGFIVTEKLLCDLQNEEMKTVLTMIDEASRVKPQNFHIKILTLDPDSNYTNERASDLNIDRQFFRENMRRDLNETKKVVESNRSPASIVVKIYDAYPTQMTYFFDNYVISSAIAMGRSSRDCTAYIHSLVDRGARETFEKHFDYLWGQAKLYATNNLPVQ